MSKDYIQANQGEYPVYSSQTENNGELGKISSFDYEGEYLTWTTDGANAGSVFYRNGRFSITNVCGLLKVNKDDVITRYIYHSLQIEAPKYVNKGMGNPKLMSNVMARIKLAVPPLEVQREIVRILDSFTLLTAELTAELTARKQQYEYYTQHLLVNADGLECKLGDVATLKTGRKPEKILEEETSYEYINAGTSNSGYVDGSNCDGDTTTTPSRGQGGIGFVGYQKNNFWLGPLCYRIKSNDTDVVLNKFIYFYLKCFPELILQYKKEGGTPSVNASDLVNIPIIIPDIKEQKRIISVLSHFETICTDISTGLPAEIEARHKQYEYYRDKLLTFTQLA